MSILNLCTRKVKDRKAFERFADQLIEDGVKDYVDLCEADKCELVGLLINALDFPDEWMYDDGVITGFTRFMCDNTRELREEFIETMRQRALSYFDAQLKEYINDLVNDMDYARNEDYYKEHSYLLDPEWHTGAHR